MTAKCTVKASFLRTGVQMLKKNSTLTSSLKTGFKYSSSFLNLKYGQRKENIIIIRVWYKLFGRKDKRLSPRAAFSRGMTSYLCKESEGRLIAVPIKPESVTVRTSVLWQRMLALSCSPQLKTDSLPRPGLSWSPEPSPGNVTGPPPKRGRCAQPSGSPEYQLLVLTSRWTTFPPTSSLELVRC